MVRKLGIPEDFLGYQLVTTEFASYYDSSNHALSISVLYLKAGEALLSGYDLLNMVICTKIST